jgi:peptidoglycan hydrolase-like protein with peptidoglycan-binding domain
MNTRSKIVSVAIAVAAIIPMVNATHSADAAPTRPVIGQVLTQDQANNREVFQAQTKLRSWGYTVTTSGLFDDSTARAVRHVQRANGLPQTGVLDAATLKVFGISGTPQVAPPAPPTTTASPTPAPPAPASSVVGKPGDCQSYGSTLAKYGMPKSYFLRVMNRESGCLPLAYNGKNRDRSYGLLQINTKGALWGEIKRRCGLTNKNQLFDPETNIMCGSKLYAAYGKRPWGG